MCRVGMRRWMMENLDGWIAKAEVVEKTKLTERTLERMVKRGELRRDYRNIPGRKPLPVFHPEDVERLTTKTLTPIPMKRNGIPRSRQLVPTSRQLPIPTSASVAVSLSLNDKFYLTLEEAAFLFGLPLSYLRKKIQGKEIPAVKLAG
jgi:hypothetical protein